MKVLFLDIDGVLNSAQSDHFFHKERERAKAGHPGFLDALGRRALRQDEFCPLAVSNLLDIIDEFPDLRIVVSSSWRLGREVEELRDIFEPLGIRREIIIDKTPVLHRVNGVSVQRGEEIKKWLDNYNGMGSLVPVESFVVLDDDSDMDAVWDRFVQTDWCVGLDFRVRHEVMMLFDSTKTPIEHDYYHMRRLPKITQKKF